MISSEAILRPDHSQAKQVKKEILFGEEDTVHDDCKLAVVSLLSMLSTKGWLLTGGMELSGGSEASHANLRFRSVTSWLGKLAEEYINSCTRLMSYQKLIAVDELRWCRRCRPFEELGQFPTCAPACSTMRTSKFERSILASQHVEESLLIIAESLECPETLVVLVED